jgi:hypothetical protein
MNIKYTTLVLFATIFITPNLVSCADDNNQSTTVKSKEPAPNTPVSFFESVRIASTSGDVSLVWNQLPTSVQSKLDSLVREFATNQPEDIYIQIRLIIERISTLMQSKREFIINTPIEMWEPFAAPLGPSRKAKSALHDLGWNGFVSTYDMVAETALSISTNDQTAYENLPKFSSDRFLKEEGKQLFATLIALSKVFKYNRDLDVDELNEMLFCLGSIQTKLIKEDGDAAIVQVSILEPRLASMVSRSSSKNKISTKELELTKIDGKWFSPMLFQAIQAAVESGKEEILNMVDEYAYHQEYLEQVAEQITLIISMATTYLTALENAATQIEFNIALERAMQFINRF